MRSTRRRGEPTSQRDYNSSEVRRTGRRHEPPAPVLDVCELPLELAPQVPWKQYDEVGSRLLQVRLVDDRDPTPGHELAALRGASIDDERHEVRFDPRVIEKR